VLVVGVTDWAYSRVVLATRNPHADARLVEQAR
jgi:hypothetical protein